MIARRTATDIYGTGVVRLTVGLDDVQAGNLSLQGTRDVVVRTVGDRFAVQVFDRADELGLLQGAVTDDDRRLEGLMVFLKEKINLGTFVDTLLDGFVAEELADENAVRRSLDRVGTIGFRHIPDIGTFHNDGGAGDGFIRTIVDDHAGNRHVLCINHSPQEQSQGGGCTSENPNFHKLGP